MPSVVPAGFDVPGLHESMPETKAISFADNRSEFFENLLDIVNPLQHIPVVSTVYRAVTGDQIAAPARLIGGALFGGPLGLASASANLFLEEATGGDLASHALALVNSFDDAPQLAGAAVPVAAATPPAPQAATNLATANDGVEIIWSGPRVLPSLASAAAVRGGATGARAGDPAVEISDAGASASDGGPFGPSKTSTAAPNLGARPPWLEAAIADAQSVQGAAQSGQTAQKVQGQPWVTDAMLDALSKYEIMARERNQ